MCSAAAAHVGVNAIELEPASTLHLSLPHPYPIPTLPCVTVGVSISCVVKGFIGFVTVFLSEDDIFELEDVIASEMAELTSQPLRVGRLVASVALCALGSDHKQLFIEAQVVGGNNAYRSIGLYLPVNKFICTVRDSAFFRDLEDLDAEVAYRDAWRRDRIEKHVSKHGHAPRDADVRTQERELFGGHKPDARRPFLCEAAQRMRTEHNAAVAVAAAAAAAADAAASWRASAVHMEATPRAASIRELPPTLNLSCLVPIVIKPMHDLKVAPPCTADAPPRSRHPRRAAPLTTP